MPGEWDGFDESMGRTGSKRKKKKKKRKKKREKTRTQQNPSNLGGSVTVLFYFFFHLTRYGLPIDRFALFPLFFVFLFSLPPFRGHGFELMLSAAYTAR
jgi:hypothetical protein